MIQKLLEVPNRETGKAKKRKTLWSATAGFERNKDVDTPTEQRLECNEGTSKQDSEIGRSRNSEERKQRRQEATGAREDSRKVNGAEGRLRKGNGPYTTGSNNKRSY